MKIPQKWKQFGWLLDEDMQWYCIYRCFWVCVQHSTHLHFKVIVSVTCPFRPVITVRTKICSYVKNCWFLCIFTCLIALCVDDVSKTLVLVECITCVFVIVTYLLNYLTYSNFISSHMTNNTNYNPCLRVYFSQIK